MIYQPQVKEYIINTLVKEWGMSAERIVKITDSQYKYAAMMMALAEKDCFQTFVPIRISRLGNFVPMKGRFININANKIIMDIKEYFKNKELNKI